MATSIHAAKAEYARLAAERPKVNDSARNDCCRRYDITSHQREFAQERLEEIDARMAELSKVIGTSYTKPVLGLTALAAVATGYATGFAGTGYNYATGLAATGFNQATELAGAGYSYATGLAGAGFSYATGLVGAATSGASDFVASNITNMTLTEAASSAYETVTTPSEWFPEASSKNIVIGLSIATVTTVLVLASRILYGKQKVE